MDEETKKIIKERFDALPKNIQDTILSTNYQEALIEFGKKYQLNVEQLGILERETTLVMMGLTSLKDFEVELTRELNIDKVKGNQIVNDINEKVFLKVRESLKTINTPNEENSPTPVGMTTPQNNGSQILNSAGIKIIPNTPATPSMQMQAEKLELPTESREDMLKKIEKPEMIHPILEQKLSGSVQTGVAQTEHTLNNLTPNSNVSPAMPKKVDPYREIPE